MRKLLTALVHCAALMMFFGYVFAGDIRAENIQVTKIKVEVTFFNEDYGVSMLGLAKFILNEHGDPVDYELLNIRWSEKERVVGLLPGLYSVTKYIPLPNTSIFRKIKGYQEFEVKDKKVMIHFPSIKTIFQFPNI